ncbi:MAG: hypothetical protein CMJ78_06155 [Planctomycetaceae bacterium]|nr:hypothetical protein [Planctomycetaceae bacterium]
MLSAQTREERSLEAARGYLILNMGNHALRELRQINEPLECAYERHCLMGEAHRCNNNIIDALASFEKA